MSLLFETIRIEDGEPLRIDLHEDRMDLARTTLLGAHTKLFLRDSIKVPLELQKGRVKCRVEYDTEIHRLTYFPYEIRLIQSLQIAEVDDISYEHKFSDRSQLGDLVRQNPASDDVLIVCNGQVTDCSYANVLLERNGMLFTPDTPLLAGTRRQALLDIEQIVATEIRIEDLGEYDRLHLINAMLDPGDCSVSIGNIVY